MSSPLHESNEQSSTSQPGKMIHHLENFESNKWLLEQQSKYEGTNVRPVGSDQEIVAPKCGASNYEYVENKLISDHETAGNSDYQDQMTNKKDFQLVKGVEYEVCRRSKFKVTRI